MFADDLALAERDQFHLLLQQGQKRFIDRREERHAAQMMVQGALAIFFIDVRLERGAFERSDLHFRRRLRHGIDFARAHQHVENDAQHLDHDAILARHDRGRARLKRAAGHFAKKFASVELGQRAVDREIDGSVDRNEHARVLFALLLAIGDEDAFHPRHEPAQTAARLHVGDPVGDENIDLPRHDVERGRSERAFLADDVAAFESAQHRRALGPLQLRRGDFFKPRQILEQLLRAQRLAPFEFVGAGTGLH